MHNNDHPAKQSGNEQNTSARHKYTTILKDASDLWHAKTLGLGYNAKQITYLQKLSMLMYFKFH